MRTLIKHVLSSAEPKEAVTVKGWVRTRRDSKGFSFLELNDGSCLANLQIVVDAGTPGSEHMPELTTEFLRTIAHLRPCSNLYGAVFRMRSKLAFAVHQFFQERDFVYVHTPIITASDCEGAGEMFRVTSLKGNIDEKPQSDFFGKPTYLTVSGQLEGETFASALSNIYTFGPTFRAENSNTARHAAEFWMIEPEMAFCDLQGDMDLGEEFMKAMARYALEHCAEDLGLFAKFVDKGLRDRLKFVVERPFVRAPYTEAIGILKKSGKKFEFPVEYGLNLQSEHERFLTEEHCKSPVTVFNYPREIKPFYM